MTRAQVLTTARLLPVLLLCALLCSCNSTSQGGGMNWSDSSASSSDTLLGDKDLSSGGFLGLGGQGGSGSSGGLSGQPTDPLQRESTAWIKDSPDSAALDPKNWLDYSAFYLGEIVLAPFRLIQLIIDGA